MSRGLLLLVGVALGLGTVSAQFVRVDPAFSAQIGGPVFALALQADNRILIGGLFTNVDGFSRPYLARLNPDGSLDQSFIVAEGTLSAFVNGILLAESSIYVHEYSPGGTRRLSPSGALERTYSKWPSAVDSKRRLLWGGVTETCEFARLGRVTEDGSPDPGFPARVDCYHNRGVQAIAIQNDSGQEKILIGGSFIEVNTSYSPGLARLNEDGSLDTSFKGSTLLPIESIRMWQDGRFYTMTSRSVARHLPDGSPDPDFEIFGSQQFEGLYGMAIQPDGKLVVFGDYCGSICRPVIRQLNRDGTIDTNFSVHVDHYARAVAIQPDGGILIAGSFTNVNCLRRPFLARLISSNTPDALPCVSPPPKPEPLLFTTIVPRRKIIVNWTAGYPEYTLQAARLLHPRRPERDKWKTVTNTPVCDDHGCWITNKIARYGRHYRLVKQP